MPDTAGHIRALAGGPWWRLEPTWPLDIDHSPQPGQELLADVSELRLHRLGRHPLADEGLAS